MITTLSRGDYALLLGIMADGFGPAIKKRRDALGLTQTELADRAGVERAHLSQVERGRITLPNADFRRRIAGALGMSHAALLVAAGELTEEEAGLGLAYQPPFDESDPRYQVIEMMRLASDAGIDLVLALLRGILAQQPKVLREGPNRDPATAGVR